MVADAGMVYPALVLRRPVSSGRVDWLLADLLFTTLDASPVCLQITDSDFVTMAIVAGEELREEAHASVSRACQAAVTAELETSIWTSLLDDTMQAVHTAESAEAM